MEATRELACETSSEYFDSLSKELLGAPVSVEIIEHLVDHPARIEVDRQTMLAPMMIAVDGPDDVRTVTTIEREPEITG